MAGNPLVGQELVAGRVSLAQLGLIGDQDVDPGVAGVAEGAGVDVVAGAKGAPPPLMMSTRS